VQGALTKGKILIANGTTTGYVAEEILNIELEKWRFPSGLVTLGRQCATPDDKIRSLLIDKGQMLKQDVDFTDYEESQKFIKDFGSNDVYIKGANAIDAAGNAGFLLAHPTGGSLGLVFSTLVAQGSHFIIPVGLEKMIKSVTEASRSAPGIHKFKYSFGRGCGYMAVSQGTVITEIEALKLLTGVVATHLASGGVGGSEGAVTLSLYGDDNQIDLTYDLLKSIKGEKALKGWKKKCSQCDFKCTYQEV